MRWGCIVIELLWSLRQLIRPFGYLAIRHKSKKYFDWIIPLLLSIISFSMLSFLNEKACFFEEGGMLSRMLSFFEILPGFFVASLAAVATFNRNDIDAQMPEPAPEFSALVNSRKVNIKLSRRRFLCMLFSFLTAHTILFILIGSLILSLVEGRLPGLVYMGLCAVILTIFWQTIVATMLGLYYLGERMHQA